MTDLHNTPAVTATDVPIVPSRGSATLMHGMGDRLGVDVDRAASSGIIDAPELTQMVTQCAKCTQHDACILWMMDHQGQQTFAPDYCLNSHELSYIRSVQNRRR
jgi:hypothetical protein